MKHRVFTWFTLLSVAVSGFVPAAAEGLYVCLGDDGHVALSDAECVPCCMPGEQVASQPRPSTAVSSRSECPPCVDLPLDVASAARVSIASSSIHMVVAPVCATAMLAVQAPALAVPEASLTVLHASPLHIVRSTVLII